MKKSGAYAGGWFAALVLGWAVMPQAGECMENGNCVRRASRAEQDGTGDIVTCRHDKWFTPEMDVSKGAVYFEKAIITRDTTVADLAGLHPSLAVHGILPWSNGRCRIGTEVMKDTGYGVQIFWNGETRYMDCKAKVDLGTSRFGTPELIRINRSETALDNELHLRIDALFYELEKIAGGPVTFTGLGSPEGAIVSGGKLPKNMVLVVEKSDSDRSDAAKYIDAHLSDAAKTYSSADIPNDIKLRMDVRVKRIDYYFNR